jgi:hypothetical protein
MAAPTDLQPPAQLCIMPVAACVSGAYPLSRLTGCQMVVSWHRRIASCGEDQGAGGDGRLILMA